jgi:hypothetical protein
LAIDNIDQPRHHHMLSGESADGSAGIRFDSQKNLAKATAEWPMSRLADSWNKLPTGGLKRMKKFMDSKNRMEDSSQPVAC